MSKAPESLLENESELEIDLRDLIHPCPSLLNCGMCQDKHIHTMNLLDPDFEKIPLIVARWLRSGMPTREMLDDNALGWYWDHDLTYWLAITCCANPERSIPWVMGLLTDEAISLRARDFLLFHGLRAVIRRFGHQEKVAELLNAAKPVFYDLLQTEDESFVETLIYTFVMLRPHDLQTHVASLNVRFGESEVIQKALNFAGLKTQ